jgi:hypothetical protein
MVCCGDTIIQQPTEPARFPIDTKWSSGWLSQVSSSAHIRSIQSLNEKQDKQCGTAHDVLRDRMFVLREMSTKLERNLSLSHGIVRQCEHGPACDIVDVLNTVKGMGRRRADDS